MRRSRRSNGASSLFRRYRGVPNIVSTAHPRPELKYIDLSLTSEGMDGIEEITLLNGAAQGTAANERVGTLCNFKDVYCNLTIRLPSAPANQIPVAARIMFVWDKQPNGALPAATDLLSGAGTFWGVNNLDNRDRFITLAKRIYSLSPNGDQIITDNIYARINMQTSYSGSGGTIAAVKTGALLLCYVSTTSSDVNEPLLTIQTRAKFVDP